MTMIIKPILYPQNEKNRTGVIVAGTYVHRLGTGGEAIRGDLYDHVLIHQYGIRKTERERRGGKEWWVRD